MIASSRISALVSAGLGFALCLSAFGQQTPIVPNAASSSSLPRLIVSAQNLHYLATESGAPFFLNADTAWRLGVQIPRDQVPSYLAKRKAQKFNAVAFLAAAPPDTERQPVEKRFVGNIYGDAPFQSVKRRWAPAQPLTTPGDDPNNPDAYDYWDHIDFVVDQVERAGLYAILLPTWGSTVAGNHDGKVTAEIIFNKENAYAYGNWIGRRYAHRTHVIWMLGGDRSAVYGDLDYRPVFRAMAEGIADGVNGLSQPDGQADWSTTLMSYHPRKLHPNSSEWFHRDGWLDFNSIQEWPEDQIAAIAHDFALEPAKPTCLLEGRYEGYYKGGYKPEQWGAWQTRYQAYQSVFAGGFGHTYGHERVFGFGQDGADWRQALEAPGARQMQHLYALMTSLAPGEFFSRIPDQDLIVGDAGAAQRLKSSRLQATRGSRGDYAMIYSANGRNIRARMDRLTAPSVDAFWFNPRNGRWRVDAVESPQRRPFATKIPSGPQAPDHEFDPPASSAEGNDWVLVLRAAE